MKNSNLETVKAHVLEYVSEGNTDVANYLNKLHENPKIQTELNNDDWDNVIEYTYQQLLAHSMEDGSISDVERQELQNIKNLKGQWGQNKDSLKFRINTSLNNVEKSHHHNDKYETPKPSPWDNNKNKK